MLGLYYAAFFVLLAYVCDFLELTLMRGKFIAFILAVVAFGFSIIALPFIPQPGIITVYPANAIYATSPAFNTTIALPASETTTFLALGYFSALIHFAMIFVMLGAMFWMRKQKRARELDK